MSIINVGSWSLAHRVEQKLTRLALYSADRHFSQSETSRYGKPKKCMSRNHQIQDNLAVLEFVKEKSVENLWTGLVCVGHDPFSCTWDVKSGTTAAYSNFAKGSPRII